LGYTTPGSAGCAWLLRRWSWWRRLGHHRTRGEREGDEAGSYGRPGCALWIARLAKLILEGAFSPVELLDLRPCDLGIWIIAVHSGS